MQEKIEYKKLILKRLYYENMAKRIIEAMKLDKKLVDDKLFELLFSYNKEVKNDLRRLFKET